MQIIWQQLLNKVSKIWSEIMAALSVISRGIAHLSSFILNSECKGMEMGHEALKGGVQSNQWVVCNPHKDIGEGIQLYSILIVHN